MFSVSFASLLQDIELQKLFKEFVKDKLKKPISDTPSGPDNLLVESAISATSATLATAATSVTSATSATSRTAATSAKSATSRTATRLAKLAASSSSSSRSSSYIRYENISSPPRYMYTIDLPEDIREGLRVSNLFVFIIIFYTLMVRILYISVRYSG